MAPRRGSHGSMRFHEKLTRLLAQRRISQSELGRRTGLSQSSISLMTVDRQRPYLWQAFRIAQALEVGLDYLADDDQDEPSLPQELTPEEVAVLTAYRASGISSVEAVRGILDVVAGIQRAQAPGAIDVNPRDRIRPAGSGSTQEIPTPERTPKKGTGSR